MSEIKEAIAAYEAAERKKAAARTMSEHAKADADLQAAFDRIVSAETRSGGWDDDDHDRFDGLMARRRR